MGQIQKARGELARYHPATLARKDRYELASVARRAGLPYLTLRLLWPMVRPSPKNPSKASDPEIAEYAAALVRVGASREAFELLGGINRKETPQVDLYLAHALFTQWEYERAIPLLRQYLQTPLSPYQRVIGQVNLASAFVHERLYSEASELLQELEKETLKQRLATLYGNTLERLAELAIHQRDWRAADRHLKRADRAVTDAGGRDEFFVRKWRMILRLFQKPSSTLKALEEFQSEAKEKEHWETARECDAYRAIVCKDEAIYLRVYFGTPYLSYRNRLSQDFGEPVHKPESFVWQIGDGRPLRRKWDLLYNPKELKFDQLKQRLLRTLASDFYRPFRTAHLFAETYPGEIFRISSSRARVYEGIKSLRGWLKAEKIPLQISEKRGEYRLESCGPQISLVIPSDEWLERNTIKGMDRIRSEAGEELFSAQDVARWLKLPRRTAFEVIRQATEKQLITRLGAGAHTRYRIKT
jgi:hypothetical protein